ncbi:MAG: hypothetical protein ACE5JJ_01585 [Nitrospinota bacterium]
MTLEERLSRLERQNRRLKQVGALALALLGSILLMGQALPKSRTVEAEKLVLKDPKGRERARLWIDKNGPRLTFYDEKGTSQDSIVVDLGASWTGEAGLFLYNRLRGTRVALETDIIGGIRLQYTKNGKQLLELEANDLGPSISLWDKKTIRILLALWGNEARLTLNGENGHHRVYLGASEKLFGLFEKKTVLTFFDEKGHFRSRLHWDPQSGPSFSLFDEKEHPRTILGATQIKDTNTGETISRPESSLVLFREDGKVLRSLP